MDKPKVAGVRTGIGNLLGFSKAGFEIDYVIDDRDFVRQGVETYKQFTERVSHSFNDYYDREVDIIISSPPCAQVSKLGMKREDREALKNLTLSAENFDFFIGFEEAMMRKAKYYIIEYIAEIKKFFEFTKKGLFYIPTEDLYEFEEEMNLQTLYINLSQFNIPQRRYRFFLIYSKKPSTFVYLPPIQEEKDLPCRCVFEELDRMRAEGVVLPNDEMPRHGQERIDGFNKLAYGESYYGGANNTRINPNKIAPTIISSKTRHVHPWHPRVLNVRECAKLQGFPDDFQFFGKEQVCLDLVGKTISPPIAFDIAKQLKYHLELQEYLKENNESKRT